MKKQSLFYIIGLIFFLCLSVILIGCSSDDDVTIDPPSWNCELYSPGATPYTGHWYGEVYIGEKREIYFEVFYEPDGQLKILLENPVSPLLPYVDFYITDGSFSYSRGEIGDYDCPPGSFCFSGRFISHDDAEGTICLAVPNQYGECEIVEHFNWYAYRIY